MIVSRHGGKKYRAHFAKVCAVDYGGSMGTVIYRDVWVGEDGRPVPTPTLFERDDEFDVFIDIYGRS